MDDTDQKSRNSSRCCCFSLLRRSDQKINAISAEEDKVSRSAEQTVGKVEKYPILEEKDCLDKQQSRQDEEIDRLRIGIRQLNEELEWLLSKSYIDPWVRRHTTADNLSQTKGKKGASPNNKEQQSLPKTYSNVVRDMIGARSSPVELLPVLSFSSSNDETPPASPPRPSDGLLMSYTEIFHTLVGQGLITPLPSDTAESFLHSDTAYLQSCHYHKGQRGHSTENCIQLRCQVQKLMKEGLLKIEPPKLVIADHNNSSVLSSENISSDPGSSLVFINGRDTGHSIVKEEYDRILQEMNSPDDQLFRQQKEEKNMPQKQMSKKKEQTSDQTVPKEEYDRVFQEMNSLKNQSSLISSEVNLLKNTSEQTTGNNLSQNRSAEQQSQPATCSNIVNIYQNVEKALLSLNSVPSALFLFCCVMVTWLCFKIGVAIRVYLA